MDASFQGYYLGVSAQPLIDTTGAAFRYQSFFPSLGFLSGSLEGYGSQGQVETGENFMELRGAAWARLRWTLTAGDFRLPESMVEFPFFNLYNPDIMARGGKVEAGRGSAVFSAFYGRQMLLEGPQVPFRAATPQTVAGAGARFGVGTRFEYGVRLMRMQSDVAGIENNPFLYPTGRDYRWVDMATAQANLHLSRRFKLYTEVEKTSVGRLTPLAGGHEVPFSYTSGAVWDSRAFTLRANYAYQGTAYLPVPGYYAGDRRGPYGEIRLRPLRGLELFGSGSYYTNNLERDPAVADYRSASLDVGASATLPGKWSLTAQAGKIQLAAETPELPSENTTNYQFTGTIAKTAGRHSLRATGSDLQLFQSSFNERLRTFEVEDLVHAGPFLAGGGVRWQQAAAAQTVNSLFYRGTLQARVSRFTFNVDIEAGNDLVNQTLFATNTYRTEFAGLSVALGRNWSLSMQGFRNSLYESLNPENIFVLSSQGADVSPILSGLNQWSAFFRLTRRIKWGGEMPSMADADKLMAQQVPLRGAVEGIVAEQSMEGRFTAAGIPVTLDGVLTETTDAAGHFRFADVMEGPHTVRLSANELPAWYNPAAPESVAVSVEPRRTARADLGVARVTSIAGAVEGPAGAALDGIVIQLTPGGRSAATDEDGTFRFDDLREGDYQVALDASTLPQDAVLTTSSQMAAGPRREKPVTLQAFRFEIHPGQKPVRRIELTAPSPAAPAPPSAPANRAPAAPPPAARPSARPAAPVPARVRYGVQVGAFKSPESAETLRAAMERRYGAARVILKDELWHVVVGAESTARAAGALASRIKREGGDLTSAFVVPMEP
ncbi:MAG TPA: SPOR domain-containing protein [Bryobacteraceae bacterium]|nr:SPOR domain-containing protein [Bryobacteraceae bacterium]